MEGVADLGDGELLLLQGPVARLRGPTPSARTLPAEDMQEVLSSRDDVNIPIRRTVIAREPPGGGPVEAWIAARKCLWHATRQLEPLHHCALGEVLPAMALHPAGTLVAVAQRDEVLVFDVRFDRDVVRLRPQAGLTVIQYSDGDLRGNSVRVPPLVRGLAFSRDGERLLCIDLAGLARVYRVDTWALLASWPNRENPMGLCAVGSGSEAIVMPFTAPPYRADLERQEIAWTAGPEANALGSLWDAWALDAAGQRLALFRRYGAEVVVLDTATGRLAARVSLPGERAVTSVAFGRSAELLVGTSDGQVYRVAQER